MKFVSYKPGSNADVLGRNLRVQDLPRPTTNREAERAVNENIAARQRALMRVSGFADVAPNAVGDAVVSSGAAAGGFALGTGADVTRAILLGIGVTVGATFVLRFIDSLFKRSA